MSRQRGEGCGRTGSAGWGARLGAEKGPAMESSSRWAKPPCRSARTTPACRKTFLTLSASRPYTLVCQWLCSP
jgi:hypothetical protein